MPRKNKLIRKLRKSFSRAWTRITLWPWTVAYWALDTAEDWLIGLLEAVNRGQEKMGDGDWDD